MEFQPLFVNPDGSISISFQNTCCARWEKADAPAGEPPLRGGHFYRIRRFNQRPLRYFVNLDDILLLET